MALRRKTDAGPNALVAAARGINLGNPAKASKEASRRQEWQAEAWSYFDEVPELKEAVRYRGNQVGKVRLYVAVADPDDPDGEPIPVDAEASRVPAQVAAQATAELARLRARSGGQSEIMRELDMNLEVAGECYLVGYGAWTEQVRQRDGTLMPLDHPEDWAVKSISEVEVKNPGGTNATYVVKAHPGDIEGKSLDPERDTIIRIWQRHPQWGQLPDSAVRGLLGECRTLQVLVQQVLAEANSRQSAGLITVPNTLSFGPPDSTVPEDGMDDDPDDPFEQELLYALTAPIEDPSSAASVMPMVLRGPPEDLKPDVLRHIHLGRDTSESLEKRIDARVARIARGLNLPVEKIMGHQETTYANAAQVDEDEYNDYLRPSVDTATDALTFAFLRPQLLENPAVPNEWADQLFITADPSQLIREPDTEANANDGFDRGAISWAAWRRAKGFSEEDAPEPVELLQVAGLRRGILTPEVTMALLQLLDGPPIDVEPLPQAPQGPSPDAPPPPMPDAAVRAGLHDLLSALAEQGAADPALVDAALAQLAGATPTVLVRQPPPALPAAATENPVGRQLAMLDRELRTRLVVAADDAMTRALERAANRLRGRTNGTELRQLLRKVPLEQSFRHLGPSLVAQAFGDDDPLEGAWDSLEHQFMTWGANSQGDAIDLASRAVSGFTAAERDALKLRQVEDLAEAWLWMSGALDALAGEHLYGTVTIPELGEWDPTLKVPTGLVRQGVARAGGAKGLLEVDAGTFITLADGGTRPAGGIGTGDAVARLLRDHGATTEAYRWVYGPAFRAHPFDPHRNLDGTVFEHFDDDVLTNGSGWPPFAYYMPGDHTGCLCDYEPIIVAAEAVA